MLIFQSKEHQLAGYRLGQGGVWTHCFSMEGRKFRLDFIQNRILVGLNVKTRIKTLLEIGGGNDAEIITEMEISAKKDLQVVEGCPK